MELVLILAILAVAVWFVFFRNKEEKQSDAPYKVEAPVVTKTGDVVVTSVPESVNTQITDAVTQAAAPAAVVETPVVETPAVVEEKPAKKPRKPRTPKAKVEEKPKKVAVKKAAPPKKAAAMKAPKSKKS